MRIKNLLIAPVILTGIATSIDASADQVTKAEEQAVAPQAATTATELMEPATVDPVASRAVDTTVPNMPDLSIIDQQVSNQSPATVGGNFDQSLVSDVQADENQLPIFDINGNITGYMDESTIIYYSVNALNDKDINVPYYFSPTLNNNAKPENVLWTYLIDTMLSNFNFYHSDKDPYDGGYKANLGFANLGIDQPQIEDLSNNAIDPQAVPEVVDAPAAVADSVVDPAPAADPAPADDQPSLPNTGEAEQAGLAVFGMAMMAAGIGYFPIRRRQ